MTNSQQERIIEEGRSDYRDNFCLVDNPYDWYHQKLEHNLWLRGVSLEKRFDEEYGDEK